MNRHYSTLTAPARSLIAALALGLASVSAMGQDARKIDWQDLLPASINEMRQEVYEVNKTLDALPDKTRETYEQVQEELSVNRRIEAGFLTKENMGEEYRAMLADPPSKRYPQALAFWQRVEALQKRIKEQESQANQTINGQSIRMPGYVLPLEYDGKLVTEFLLVPFVGACIHTPPPPANQMVYVKASKGFESEGTFKPVWVQGIIKAEGGTHKLSLVDGASDVQASYSMSAITVEDYQPK